MPQYNVISSDSHLEVRPQSWHHRVPEQFRDRAPRVIRQTNGGDAFLIEGVGPTENPQDLYGGKTPQTWKPFLLNYDEVAGTGSAEQRLREQDIDGVDAEILFPSQVGGPSLWRNISDDTVYKAIVRGYNEWLAEEYCATNPQRLIGLGVIPWTNVDDAIEEMNYCLKLGLKSVSVGVFPSGKGYPTPEDDKFWAAAVDQNVPLCIHVSFNRGGSRANHPKFKYPKETPEIMSMIGRRTLIDRVSRYGLDPALTPTQLTLAGVFDRFPTLKFFQAETHIGWLPFWLESADLQYERNFYWSQQYLGVERLARMPSEYIKDHFYWSLQGERHGIHHLRHDLGVDKLMWATDFPHIESDFPHSQEIILEEFAGVPEDEKRMMLAGNAIKYFHLNES